MSKRESIDRIEMTDEEWIAARKPRALHNTIPSIEAYTKTEIDEPQKNEVAKKKPSKVRAKSNKATMAGIQKKL